MNARRRSRSLTLAPLRRGVVDVLPQIYATKRSLAARELMYRSQYTHAGYSSFRSSTRVVGIYDDHDYGENDGHGGFADKEPSRHLFLDFVDEPPSSARRSRDGIYVDYLWGPPDQRVKLILLDGRYNQDPVADDMLGAAQWSWLDDAIHSDDADLYILATGVQLVSTDKRIGEGWRLKPKSRAKVLDLFSRRTRNRSAGLVFLSGDIHLAEADVTYTCAQLAADSDSSVTVTPFYEFTSSGLTHSVASKVSDLVARNVLPWILNERASHAETLDRKQSIRGFYAGLNFGQIDVDWTERRVKVSMVDVDGKARLEYTLPFSTLSSTTYRNEMSLPAFLSAKCEEERLREASEPMFVIASVKVAMIVIVLAQLGLAILVAGCWHAAAKRAEWKAKARATRDAFKLTLDEKAAKKKN
jgi:hypothetical protein